MYFLNRQAFFCADGQYYVILDLPRDRYLCIEKRWFEPLATMLSSGEAHPPRATTPSIPWSKETEQIATNLVEHGILTLNPIASKAACRADVARPTVSVFASRPSSDKALSMLTRVRFVHSACLAHFDLRLRRIDKVVSEIDARKRGRRTPATSQTIERATGLVRLFTRLRHFFPRDYLCLFDSLALLNFLRLHGIFAAWVFGVRAEPFAAHCWVQLGDVVLNDTLEEVQQYTPIMVV